jgi:ribosomal protein S14
LDNKERGGRGEVKLEIKCASCGRVIGYYDGDDFVLIPPSQMIVCRKCFDEMNKRVFSPVLPFKGSFPEEEGEEDEVA